MNRYAMVRDGALDLRASRAWTTQEAVEAEALRAMGTRIKAIRNASDVAEAAVLAATTIEAVDAVRPEWP